VWLPGLAFKATAKGGGYAPGRNLAAFFLLRDRRRGP
jgi:hypothetical protein